MIKKELKRTLKLQKLEALLRRLPSNYPKRHRIEEEYSKCIAGYRGEKSLLFHLDGIDSKEFIILHDVRLPQDEKYFFQMDTIILSPVFAVILEIKNMSGTLCFDQKYNQLLRTQNGREDAFPDPILQLQRQHGNLEKWFEKHKLPPVPIISYIVISNPSTVIKSIPMHSDTIQKKVIHAAKLPGEINKLNKRYKNTVMTNKDLNRISRLLVRQHAPYDPDVLQTFQVLPSDLLIGVHCTNCGCLPMRRVSGSWFCMKCHFSSKDAHIESLMDYAMLIETSITTKETLKFLMLASNSSASRILKSLNLPYTGTYKNRRYQLPK
ncbi:nuclease-related domain-containing protein [Bacillus sp. V2I10]|uniref:nuclease-related domain-containing protein n=1 Tax=Bacillus sp. V2I10 TaxID=3042276 RepID=UPI0027855F2A|nr:nuclease-related domain-containing protein [Bacillus sp. V2I10]MDQ0857121.1 hypothetical protein [Bacillus sp. V2I10]